MYNDFELILRYTEHFDFVYLPFNVLFTGRVVSPSNLFGFFANAAKRFISTLLLMQ